MIVCRGDFLQADRSQRPCQRGARSIRGPARPAITAVHPDRKIMATRPPACGCTALILGTLGIMATRVAKGAPRPRADAPGGQARPAPGRPAHRTGRRARPVVPGGQPARGRAPARTRCPRAPARARAGTARPARGGTGRTAQDGTAPGRTGRGGAGSGSPPRAVPADGPAAAADRGPDPDPGGLAGQAGGRAVDGRRARGRVRRAQVRQQRTRPGPAAPAGRRGPGLPGGGLRRGRHHLVPHPQLRRADAGRPVPGRVRLSRLDRAPAAWPARLAIPAPPRPQRADRADGDRLDLPGCWVASAWCTSRRARRSRPPGRAP